MFNVRFATMVDAKAGLDIIMCWELLLGFINFWSSKTLDRDDVMCRDKYMGEGNNLLNVFLKYDLISDAAVSGEITSGGS